MASRTSATPLAAIEAVVLDTETTSLDVARARIVAIGAVRLRAGRLSEDEVLDSLVNPGEPIPPAATRIHGIRTQDVAAAPDFATLQPDLVRFIGLNVVIGHSLGFDLAVWRNEARRAHEQWHAPRMLDTRLLAEIANPRLPGFDLETVAHWLNIEVAPQRHQALYDATLTARIYFALIPFLRAREIRTVAEAESACRKLTSSLNIQHQAGWIEPVRAPPTERSLARIDSYPYRHRVREVMTSPPLIADTATPLAEIIALMAARNAPSVFLVERYNAHDRPPKVIETGIITERDILNAIAGQGAAALVVAAREIMSHPVTVVPSEAYLYRAIGRMGRLRIGHLGVQGPDGRLVGALTQRDMLRMRAEEAISLGDEIDNAAGETELAAAWARLPAIASSLMQEGVPAHDIAGVISRELGALTRRAGQLAEARLIARGEGPAPAAHALLLLGSGGRGESLLAADQDNAIVYAADDPEGECERWFAAYGEILTDILSSAGLPHCSGGVSARNADWRGSLATWRRRVETWLRRSRPEDLLSVDIFFDARAVHGDLTLGDGLIVEAFDRARTAPDFAKLLAENTAAFHSPLGIFGRIRTEQGRVNLKAGGALPIVSIARLLAIRHHVLARSTTERLAAIRALALGGDGDLGAYGDDLRLIVRLTLTQQLEDIEAGIPLSSRIELKKLDRETEQALKAALGRIGHARDLTRSLLFAHARPA